MIEIFVFVILVGMFFVDHRLSRLLKIQRAILEELRKKNYGKLTPEEPLPSALSLTEEDRRNV